ncbi:putative Ran1 protein, partial [Thamnocephalis sphaerospora]
ELELHRRVHAHPNILPLLDCIVAEDAIYLVLEYCPAGDLFDAILEVHSNPALTQRQRERWAMRTFRELVHAIHWCHQQGVWHRDIKPENILLSADGHVQLTDFGLATESSSCDERGKGSLFYMAPELLASPAEPFGTGLVDSTRADVWSLGVLLLNMLGGRNPWPCAAYHDDAFQIY